MFCCVTWRYSVAVWQNCSATLYQLIGAMKSSWSFGFAKMSAHPFSGISIPLLKRNKSIDSSFFLSFLRPFSRLLRYKNIILRDVKSFFFCDARNGRVHSPIERVAWVGYWNQVAPLPPRPVNRTEELKNSRGVFIHSFIAHTSQDPTMESLMNAHTLMRT